MVRTILRYLVLAMCTFVVAMGVLGAGMALAQGGFTQITPLSTSGGDLNGDLRMNGNLLYLDADDDTGWYSSVDDRINARISGGGGYFDIRTTNLDIGVDAVFNFANAGLRSSAGPLELEDDVQVEGYLELDDDTADPCGTYPAGSLFYNSTSGYPCYCNNAGTDLRMDGTTACF